LLDDLKEAWYCERKGGEKRKEEEDSGKRRLI